MELDRKPALRRLADKQQRQAAKLLICQVTLHGLGKATATQHWQVSPRATIRNRVSRCQPESLSHNGQHPQRTASAENDIEFRNADGLRRCTHGCRRRAVRRGGGYRAQKKGRSPLTTVSEKTNHTTTAPPPPARTSTMDECLDEARGDRYSSLGRTVQVRLGSDR